MVLSFREVSVLDANAEALGVSVASLMENAGRAVADRVAAVAGEAPVVVLAGPGNNGGDGCVAARLLANARPVTLLTSAHGAADFRSAIARDAFEAVPEGVRVVTGAGPDDVTAAVRGGTVVVDALLGVGVQGTLREPYRGLVEAVNASGARVVSVDVPSGLGTDLVVRPEETVTFHDVKAGMTEGNAGRVTVADIGIPAEAAARTGPGELKLYPRARPEQHKGEGGIVLVIGGGPYTGAPAIAGLAALRAGADLAILLTPERAWQVIASYSPNLVVRPLRGNALDFEDPENRVTLNLWLKKAGSVVIGPGLGFFENTLASTQHAIERAGKEGKPVVVDADAVAAAAEKPDLLGPNVLVTPHRREFQRLTGEDAPDDAGKRREVARLAAERLGCSLLLKGPVDVVTDGARVKENATGHPAMSVGGTGDALAGVAGALLAKGLSPFDAARVAAYVTGEAGAAAVAEKSHGLVATDVVDALPRVLAKYLP